MWYIVIGNNLVIEHCWVVFRIVFVYIYYANPQLSTSAITMPECNSSQNYCTVYCLQLTAILDYMNPTFVGILQTLLKYVLIGTMRFNCFLFFKTNAQKWLVKGVPGMPKKRLEANFQGWQLSSCTNTQQRIKRYSAKFSRVFDFTTKFLIPNTFFMLWLQHSRAYATKSGSNCTLSKEIPLK